jgi:hypothetical protein
LALPPHAVLTEFATRSEFQPAEVPPVLVRRSRHAVGHSLGCAVFPRRARGLQLSNHANLSSGFALRRSIVQRILAGRPQPPAPLMGFRSLQRSRIRRSTARGLAVPATFRPQGLVTLSAAYSLRARAGLVSYRRRSWDSPFGASSSRKVSARFRVEGPTYRFSCRCYRRRNDGPARQAAVSGLLPLRESLTADTVLARQPLAAPVGFALLGHPGNDLGQTFARPPLTRFVSIHGEEHAHRRLRVSIGRCRTRAATGTGPDGPGNPCRVFAPVTSHACGSLALRAMNSPRAASYITADRPTLLGEPGYPAGAAGIGFGAEPALQSKPCGPNRSAQ